jgi:chromosome segregation ATPase
MRRHQQQSGKLVGFYKDHRGETRPIIKPAAELNRKKVIHNGRSFEGVRPQFHGVSPEAQKRKTEQAQKQIQHLDGELQRTDSEIAKLNESIGQLKTEAQKAHYDGNDGKEKSVQKSLRLAAFTLQSKLRHKRALEQQTAQLRRTCR